MKTMYYLEDETRQKLKEFHKEKADQRLRESAKVNHSNFHLFRLGWRVISRLAHLPQRIIRFGHHAQEHTIKLERSLDEA